MSKLSKVREVVETILIGIISVGACVAAAVVGGAWAIIGAIIVTVLGVARLAYTDNEFAYKFLRMVSAVIEIIQAVITLSKPGNSFDKVVAFFRGLGAAQKFSDVAAA